jgi:hypothetical protein
MLIVMMRVKMNDNHNAIQQHETTMNFFDRNFTNVELIIDEIGTVLVRF